MKRSWWMKFTIQYIPPDSQGEAPSHRNQAPGDFYEKEKQVPRGNTGKATQYQDWKAPTPNQLAEDPLPRHPNLYPWHTWSLTQVTALQDRWRRYCPTNEGTDTEKEGRDSMPLSIPSTHNGHFFTGLLLCVFFFLRNNISCMSKKTLGHWVLFGPHFKGTLAKLNIQEKYQDDESKTTINQDKILGE